MKAEQKKLTCNFGKTVTINSENNSPISLSNKLPCLHRGMD